MCSIHITLGKSRLLTPSGQRGFGWAIMPHIGVEMVPLLNTFSWNTASHPSYSQTVVAHTLSPYTLGSSKVDLVSHSFQVPNTDTPFVLCPVWPSPGILTGTTQERAKDKALKKQQTHTEKLGSHGPCLLWWRTPPRQPQPAYYVQTRRLWSRAVSGCKVSRRKLRLLIFACNVNIYKQTRRKLCNSLETNLEKAWPFPWFRSTGVT